ncbi:MAG: hypothetical protein K6T90_17625 [Leptolyngbyaceae cyanobacterium HOT.MB2.61]|jgi:hypothetical protein|nr:hypothetical protein [Leptolyngbyaceae cyanobacterium HOT.MB2.61]
MTKTIVNLWTSLIAGEVEEVLGTYADHPFQQAFSIPDLRQELIAYVLSHTPGSYVVLEDVEEVPLNACRLQLSTEEKQLLKAWIHEGIRCIFDRHSETITKYIPEMDDPGLAPSHWFG